jgi:large subunit ribosomal protein L24
MRDEPLEKMHVKKGDVVKVISGKNAGKQGKILGVIREKKQVIIEAVNLIKRHQRPSAKVSKGGIIEREGPITASNVMVVCPKCSRTTRAQREVRAEKKVRVCNKCGEMIDQA